MTLSNDQELRTTQLKLAGLERLIADKLAAMERSPGYEAALRSLRRWEEKLKKEIEEYQGQSAASS